MYTLKSPEQIKIMRSNAKKLSKFVYSKILALEAGKADVGNGNKIELSFQNLLKGLEAEPIFSKQTRGSSGKAKAYGFSTCISVNDEVVHSQPESNQFEPGDVITIDIGFKRNGFCCDMARTAIFDYNHIRISQRTECLIKAVAVACIAAAHVAKPGNTVGDISEAIYKAGKAIDLGMITEFGGHSIGSELHEPLRIMNQPGIAPKFDKIVLRPGMIFCVEPMFTLGSSEIISDYTGWRIWTIDGSLAAHSEDMILITENGSEVLTRCN